jgi:hypothetical protein
MARCDTIECKGKWNPNYWNNVLICRCDDKYDSLIDLLEMCGVIGQDFVFFVQNKDKLIFYKGLRKVVLKRKK